MRLFILLLIVVGSIVGAIVVVILKATSVASKKNITVVMSELNLSFSPIRSDSFWIKRDWNDTLFISNSNNITGNLTSYEGISAGEKLESMINKNLKKQKDIEKGNISVNGINWIYALPTYALEGGTLSRQLVAVTGNSSCGLIFNVSLGNTNSMSETDLSELLSGLSLSGGQ
jgi:hypothetical protein